MAKEILSKRINIFETAEELRKKRAEKERLNLIEQLERGFLPEEGGSLMSGIARFQPPIAGMSIYDFMRSREQGAGKVSELLHTGGQGGGPPVKGWSFKEPGIIPPPEKGTEPTEEEQLKAAGWSRIPPDPKPGFEVSIIQDSNGITWYKLTPIQKGEKAGIDPSTLPGLGFSRIPREFDEETEVEVTLTDWDGQIWYKYEPKLGAPKVKTGIDPLTLPGLGFNRIPRAYDPETEVEVAVTDRDGQTWFKYEPKPGVKAGAGATDEELLAEGYDMSPGEAPGMGYVLLSVTSKSGATWYKWVKDPKWTPPIDTTASKMRAENLEFLGRILAIWPTLSTGGRDALLGILKKMGFDWIDLLSQVGSMEMPIPFQGAARFAPGEQGGR